MTSSTFFFFFIPLLAFILLSINFIFAPHNPYQEKNGAFECGFTSFLGQNRTQFSISFFIFALLFLLFDLEILLVYPYLVSSYNNESYGLVILLIFLAALTLGFVFELGKKALSIDSRQTIKIKNTTVNLNIAMIISPQDMISFFISLYEASNLSNIISWNNISNIASHIINYIWEEITSYLLIIITDYYTALLSAILSYIEEQCYLMTILMNYLIPLTRVLSYILERGYLVAGGVQLFITCTYVLLYSVFFHCFDMYIYVIVMSYIIAGISLFVGFNKNFKIKYPTLYKYIEIFLIISIIILTFHLGFSIYLITLYARGSSRITRSKTTANKGGGPNRPNGPNGPKPPYEAAVVHDNDDQSNPDEGAVTHDNADQSNPHEEQNKSKINYKTQWGRNWRKNNPVLSRAMNHKANSKRDYNLRNEIINNYDQHKQNSKQITDIQNSMEREYKQTNLKDYENFKRNTRKNSIAYALTLKNDAAKRRRVYERRNFIARLRKTDPVAHAQEIKRYRIERLEQKQKQYQRENNNRPWEI